MAQQIIREPQFGKRVYEKRTALGLSQTECARRLKLSRQHWNNWETGVCKPKGKRLAQLGDLLGVRGEWLVNGDQGELANVLERSAMMLRTVVRDFEHIRRAIETKGAH